MELPFVRLSFGHLNLFRSFLDADVSVVRWRDFYPPNPVYSDGLWCAVSGTAELSIAQA